jgi:HK97 family phage prohead protease
METYVLWKGATAVAELSSGARSALPDSAFAYVEPGHAVNGKTPDKFRHYPIHDKAHVQKALQLTNSPFYAKAKGKIMAAAKKHGIKAESDGDRSFESLYPEVRFVAIAPELRYAEAAGPDLPEVRHITGYAAVFNKTSRRLGDFHERVMPTAFEESRTQGWPGVVCRYNHKPEYVLGTIHGGTCQLDIDDKGLQYDVIPPETRSDVMELVDRGDVKYSSFAFRCVNEADDEWGVSKYNMPLRILHNVQVVDVAPVMDPAYYDTTAAARNMEGAVFSLARHKQADVTEVRSMLQSGQVMKFFKRTDRPSVVPSLDKVSVEERMVIDDPDVVLRSFEADATFIDPEPEQRSDETPETPEEPEQREDAAEQPEERQPRTEEEIRAIMKPKAPDSLCMRFHHGEPCVRPAGHAADGPNAAEGGHAGLCYGRADGLPCNQHDGHDGNHTPMHVASRDGEEATPPAETPEQALSVEEARKMLDKYSDELDLSIFDKD